MHRKLSALYSLWKYNYFQRGYDSSVLFGIELIVLILARGYKWCYHKMEPKMISLAEKQVVLLRRLMFSGQLVPHRVWEQSQVNVSDFC